MQDEDLVNIPEEGTVFFGVGDEVLVAGGSVLALVVVLAVWLGTSRTGNNNVHPSQMAQVERTRRDLETESHHGNNIAAEDGANNSAEMENCPVCLGGLTYAIETNCGHRFCAQCILSYWEHDQWPRPARCPVCRRQVTILLPSASFELADATLHRKLTDYNMRMSGHPRPLMHYLYDVPTLLRHLVQDFFSIGGLRVIHRLHILLILLILFVYLISPLDIIPEAALGFIGLADDLVIIAGLLVYATLVYRTFVIER